MIPKSIFRIGFICTLALVLMLACGTIVSAQDIPVKTERKKENKKRIKQKKLKGDKAKSNKRQLRQTRNKTRSKYGDRTSKGDITGRKFKQRKTPRTTYARPALSPYAGRKRQKDHDRAGRTPPPDFRKTPKGERPWKGDITGKKRIRTTSGSSARRKTYRPSNVSARTASRNAERSARSSRVAVSARSASKSSERTKTVKVATPVSVSGGGKIRRKRNPYAGKERRRGERSTDKDIAGRKLRTRGTMSAKAAPKRGYKSPDTYYGRKSGREGGRFSKASMQQGGYTSGTRSSEQAARVRRPDPVTKNFRSPRAGAGRVSVNPNVTRDPGIGSKRIKTKKVATRSISRSSERKMRVQGSIPRSISGTARIKKPRNPYAGRRQRAGERSTDKDISGRKLRTKNYRSRQPEWGGAISRPDPYYARHERSRKVKTSPIPSYVPGRESLRSSNYKGRFKQGDISPAGYYNARRSQYQGDRKARRPVTGGGGSISGRIWNNKGQALQSDLPSPQTRMATQFQGRTKSVPAGYYNPNIGRYRGDRKTIRPVTGGGGSISGRRWNNKGQALQSDLPSPQTRMATQFQGRTKSVPGGYYNPNIGRYKGEMKTRRPITGGGGSISAKRWNNNEQAIQSDLPSAETRRATQYQGSMISNPGYYNLAIGQYRGDYKTRQPKKGGGTVSGKLWNNDQQAIQVRIPGKEGRAGSQFQGNLNTKSFKGKGQPKGTEYGRSNSIIYITPGSAKKYGLFKENKAKRSAGTKYGRANAIAFYKPSKIKNYGGFVRLNTSVSRKQMHPSSNYTKGVSKNGKEEKEKIFKFGIWWSNLFKKNENQPENLKSINRKPRYDKREKDLWYE